MIRKLIALQCSILIFTVALFAQDGTPEEIILNKADVEKFISTYPNLQSDFEELGLDYDVEEGQFNLSDDVAFINKVNVAVQKQGYADYVEYFTEAATILSSYAVITLGAHQAEVQPEIQQAIDAIENNPGYTAEQKEQMLAMLKQGTQMYSDMAASQANSENVAVVKPYTDQLNALLEE